MYACVWALTNGKTEVWANERVCVKIEVSACKVRMYRNMKCV